MSFVMHVEIINVEPIDSASSCSVPTDRQLQEAIQEVLDANKQFLAYTFVPGVLGGGSYKIVALSYQQNSFTQLLEQEPCALCVTH